MRENPSLQAAHLESDAMSLRRAQLEALPDPTDDITYQPLPILTARCWLRTQWRVEQMIPYPGKLGLQGEIADLGAAIAGGCGRCSPRRINSICRKIPPSLNTPDDEEKPMKRTIGTLAFVPVLPVSS